MKELTDEQLNIAICEWRGWKSVVFNAPTGKFWGKAPNGKYALTEPPSHILGLEALGNMHEAEKGLTKEQKYLVGKYCDQLEKECGSRELAYFATARQRAIALLRVVKPEAFQ